MKVGEHWLLAGRLVGGKNLTVSVSMLKCADEVMCSMIGRW